MRVKLLLFSFYMNGWLHAFLSEIHLNECHIFGRFGVLKTESEPNFGFLHIPTKIFGTIFFSGEGDCFVDFWPMSCFIKPPLATARAAWCIGAVCLFVCLSPKCKKNGIFSKAEQFRAMVYWKPIGSRTCGFQRTHYWTPKILDGGDPPSWILTPKCKKAIFSENN